MKIWDPRAPGCQGAHSQPDKVRDNQEESYLTSKHFFCLLEQSDTFYILNMLFKLIIDHFILKVYSLGVAGEKLVVATAGRKVFQKSTI